MAGCAGGKGGGGKAGKGKAGAKGEEEAKKGAKKGFPFKKKK